MFPASGKRNLALPTAAALSVLLFGLGGCATENYVPVTDLYRPVPSVVTEYHRVREGETLYYIAWKYRADYRQLADRNGIKPPYTIYPDQRINLSKASVTNYPIKKKSNVRIKTGKTKSYKNKKPNAKQVQEKVAKGGLKRVNILWRWPAKGTVIEGFSVKGKVNKGVDFAGRKGESVYAAADGKVVYSGPGIVGYGNLIILKHNDFYLSAYAHNSRLLVKEGLRVEGGQKIAEMGSTGTNRNMLHFEIRKQGHPVDPLGYLPRR